MPRARTHAPPLRRPPQVCGGWTASNANMYATCYTCLANFHLTCLSPPLSSKPSRGYAWNCKECSEKEVKKPVVAFDDPEEVARRVLESVRVGATPLEAAADVAASSLLGGTGTTPMPSQATESQANGAAAEPSNADDGTDAEDGEAADDNSPLAALLRARQQTEIHDPTPAVIQLAKSWPFRYLGQYWTGFERTPRVRAGVGPAPPAQLLTPKGRRDMPGGSRDRPVALHDDESIFPYARSRVGRSYQIDVPETGGVPDPKPTGRFKSKVPEKVRDAVPLWSPDAAAAAGLTDDQRTAPAPFAVDVLRACVRAPHRARRGLLVAGSQWMTTSRRSWTTLPRRWAPPGPARAGPAATRPRR